ncbi:Inosine/uridine-preferring nucleoside hydrolase domain-containing protein [Mycena belliarum]|uniref:Inosine/uridine-preferring nucleoside hydrolase domain-containing protein n=1 Tax=Mycena belliarum TaxID=1033014 RepID=A0AAD6UJI7_9AGAR|nr:Inosine/uridine-preferring nucleoside hydrolase domain-containing protein [Mycena belliae]
MAQRYVWLDCDPGHDDATALLLALHCQNINLIGVSTVHGNAGSEFTLRNAARCLHAFGASSRCPDIRVYPGATKPLLRPAKHDPEIHGADGLGGVEGLPHAESPEVERWFAKDADGAHVRALDGIARALKQTWNNGNGHKVSIISSGPMTNIALFVAVYPDLLHAVEEFVFMGGGVGLGNRSAVAEYNILCDPHAAQIVLDAPVKKTMIPINVTHTAIVTRAMHAQLLTSAPPSLLDANTPLPKAVTNLRHTLSTLIGFFADSYKSTFGFNDGPPLHDALTIAYVSQPQLFHCMRYRVDVELSGTHSSGETVVDIWDYQGCDADIWGVGGKNCNVAQSVDVPGFFALFHDCVQRCDETSPLNPSENPLCLDLPGSPDICRILRAIRGHLPTSAVLCPNRRRHRIESKEKTFYKATL